MSKPLSPIDLMCQQLVHEVKVNENRKPEERVCYTATVVEDPKTGTCILVNGSAHQLEDCFIELFSRRPELRSVVQSALDKMYQIKDR